MWRPAALDVALTLVDHPSTVRQASRSPLPRDITLLLQVAAGEAEALRSAQTLTHRSQAALQAAAGFFIEQILFARQADSYRILGGSPASPRAELRRHMALLIKWLHPDGQELRAARSDLDRGIFIHRVTQAWETLKTDERRATYDQSQAEKPAPPQSRPARRTSRPQERARKPESKPESKPAKPRVTNPEHPGRKAGPQRLVVYRFERDTLLNRLLLYLQGWT